MKIKKALPVAFQFVGLCALHAGLFMVIGLAWTLVAAGAILTTLGALREAGRV